MFGIDLPAHYPSLEQWQRRQVRGAYVREQKGLCYYCEDPLTGPPRKDIKQKNVNVDLFPSNFFDHPVHLHHDHTTGMTIGAVHCECNAVLWQYENE